MSILNNLIKKRVLEESLYMINTNYTIREVAKKFNVSKSTVHNDLTYRLLSIDNKLYKKVSSILKYHLNIRHIRGGESTKRKYLLKNSK